MDRCATCDNILPALSDVCAVCGTTHDDAPGPSVDAFVSATDAPARPVDADADPVDRRGALTVDDFFADERRDTDPAPHSDGALGLDDWMADLDPRPDHTSVEAHDATAPPAFADLPDPPEAPDWPAPPTPPVAPGDPTTTPVFPTPDVAPISAASTLPTPPMPPALPTDRATELEIPPMPPGIPDSVAGNVQPPPPPPPPPSAADAALPGPPPPPPSPPAPSPVSELDTPPTNGGMELIEQFEAVEEIEDDPDEDLPADDEFGDLASYFAQPFDEPAPEDFSDPDEDEAPPPPTTYGDDGGFNPLAAEHETAHVGGETGEDDGPTISNDVDELLASLGAEPRRTANAPSLQAEEIENLDRPDRTWLKVGAGVLAAAVVVGLGVTSLSGGSTDIAQPVPDEAEELPFVDPETDLASILDGAIGHVRAGGCGPTRTGIAVHVSPGYVLTHRSTVLDDLEPTISGLAAGSVRYWDPTTDLAVADAPADETPLAWGLLSALAVGDTVYTVVPMPDGSLDVTATEIADLVWANGALRRMELTEEPTASAAVVDEQGGLLGLTNADRGRLQLAPVLQATGSELRIDADQVQALCSRLPEPEPAPGDADGTASDPAE